MAVAFGFSFGDFVAALELVSTVVNALGKSNESSNEYRELLNQLYSLESALLEVQGLQLDDFQHKELLFALRQAASQCQQTIDDFWKKIQKYQPHLRPSGSDSRVKDGWMKIKWAICRRDDVARFKADILGHTESIQILLATVQIASAEISDKNHERRHQSLLAKLQNGYIDCCQRLSTVSLSVSQGLRQGMQLLRMTTEVLQTNIQIFQVVVAIQTMIAGVPSQIERQQPVYLIDALGRYSPFHLEFVRSAEALTAVIKINFREVGEEAVQKIEQGRFVIQDSATHRDIDLAGYWETCFSPGQRVEMSIIFTEWGYHLQNTCPKCASKCSCAVDSNVECSVCGIKFCRIENVENDATNIAQREATPFPKIPDDGSQQSPEDNIGNIPSRRSPRLLDHLRQVRIHIPPHTVNTQTATNSDVSDQGNAKDVTFRHHSSTASSKYMEGRENQEKVLFSSHSNTPQRKKGGFYRQFWYCCSCGDGPHGVGNIPACFCMHVQCTWCDTVSLESPKN